MTIDHQQGPPPGVDRVEAPPGAFFAIERGTCPVRGWRFVKVLRRGQQDQAGPNTAAANQAAS